MTAPQPPGDIRQATLDPRRNALYIVILGSFVAGLITGRDLFFNVAYFFAGLMIFALIWARSGTFQIRLSRQPYPRRAQVGRYLEEHFTLTNTGPLPKLWLELYDASELPGHDTSRVLTGVRNEMAWSVQTLCIQRGVFQLGPMRLVTGDPFGLYQVERKLDATAQVVVFPAMVTLPTFELALGPLSGGDAVRRRTHYATTNAAGVRDYAPGDSFSRIHWKSTARRNRLMVKEFELDPLADVWLMLDAERHVQAGHFAVDEFLTEAETLVPDERRVFLPPTTEEYGVTIAASLARYFLTRERGVGFVTHGQHHEVIQVDRGERQLLKILESLAVLQARGRMPLEQLLVLEGDQLPRGATLIIITPSVRDSWVTAAVRLRSRGVNVVGITLDAGSFGGPSGADRIYALLAASNTPRRIVRRGDDFAFALGGTSL